ncbi:MAG: dTDP-4-dehydrorhamnose reductase [Atribacterota bacterium]
MRDKNILIIGGSGLLGNKLRITLEKNGYKVFSTYYKNKIDEVNNFFLDITDRKDVDYNLKKSNPDIIVHTAAYTNVDECEKNKDIAFKINVEGTKNLVDFAKRIDSKFVYISTDYVFDGMKGNYAEDDETNPVNYYGWTKLKGEQIISKGIDDFIIARTSVIYGVNKNNFALWIINNLKNNKKINIVDDQFISPTYNVDLCEQLFSVINNNKCGIFHTAGGERISRYNFSIKLSEMFGFNKENINKISMKDLKWLAKRPMDSSLDISKISKFKKPYTINKSLHLLKKELWGD